MADTLVMDVAKRRVREFVEKQHAIEKVLADECRECENFLKLGIEALRWLISAECFILEAARAGLATVDEPVVDAIRTLYAEWLKPCASVDVWISRLAARGHVPSNNKAFRHAENLARAAVARDAIVCASDAPLFPNEPFDFALPVGTTVRIDLQRLNQVN